MFECSKQNINARKYINMMRFRHDLVGIVTCIRLTCGRAAYEAMDFAIVSSAGPRSILFLGSVLRYF